MSDQPTTSAMAIVLAVCSLLAALAFASLADQQRRATARQWSDDVAAWERHADGMYQKGYEDGQGMARLAREVTP